MHDGTMGHVKNCDYGCFVEDYHVTMRCVHSVVKHLKTLRRQTAEILFGHIKIQRKETIIVSMPCAKIVIVR